MRVLLFLSVLVSSPGAFAEDAIQNLPEIVSWSTKSTSSRGGDHLWVGRVRESGERCDLLLYVDITDLTVIAFSLSGPLPQNRESFNVVPGLTLMKDQEKFVPHAEKSSALLKASMTNNQMTVQRKVSIGTLNEVNAEIQIMLDGNGKPVSAIGRSYSPDSQLECTNLN